MRIAVAESLKPFVEPALMRLGYLYPAVEFKIIGAEIVVGAGPETDQERLGRDIRYAIYREKVYSETLSLRQALFEAVTRR